MTILKYSIPVPAILALFLSNSAFAIEQAQSVIEKTNVDTAASQKRIDKSSERALELQSDLELLQREVENMTIYKNHLASMVENQNGELASLQKQIDEVNDTRKGVVPLMYTMLDSLKLFIEQDKPLKKNQRLDRVVDLEFMMTRADVSEAEKFRRILEAFQIEIDYGNKIARFDDTLNIDGSTRSVEVFHLGGVSLLARSFERTNYWAWNDKSRAWVAVDPAQHRELEKAYDIAANKAAPSLLSLPISAQQGGK